jgi:hypothetical protein
LKAAEKKLAGGAAQSLSTKGDPVSSSVSSRLCFSLAP